MAESGKNLPAGVTTADEFGKYHAKKLAHDLSADYRHIEAEEMTGEIHNERALYFDSTGKFNPGILKEMPVGFISSSPKFALPDDYCQKELSALCGIALGSHGFGDKFTKENPFYIIVSAGSEEDLTKLKRAAKLTAEKFEGRIAVDGFIVK